MSMALDYVFLKAWTTYDSVMQFKHKRRKTQNESSDGGFQLERVDLETLPDNAVEKNEAILDTGEHIFHCKEVAFEDGELFTKVTLIERKVSHMLVDVAKSQDPWVNEAHHLDDISMEPTEADMLDQPVFFRNSFKVVTKTLLQ